MVAHTLERSYFLIPRGTYSGNTVFLIELYMKLEQNCLLWNMFMAMYRVASWAEARLVLCLFPIDRTKDTAMHDLHLL